MICQQSWPIASSVALSDKMGPLSLSFGATQTQYPGRAQIERTQRILEAYLNQVYLGQQDLLCDALDRCHQVSAYLLDRAPAWLSTERAAPPAMYGV